MSYNPDTPQVGLYPGFESVEAAAAAAAEDPDSYIDEDEARSLFEVPYSPYEMTGLYERMLTDQRTVPDAIPENVAFKNDAALFVQHYLKELLSERNYCMFEHEFGLNGHKEKKRSEIAPQFNVSRGRAAQIVDQGLHKLYLHVGPRLRFEGPRSGDSTNFGLGPESVDQIRERVYQQQALTLELREAQAEREQRQEEHKLKTIPGYRVITAASRANIWHSEIKKAEAKDNERGWINGYVYMALRQFNEALGEVDLALAESELFPPRKDQAFDQKA